MPRWTRKAFAEWLDKRDDGAVVGIAFNSRNCPLANFSGQRLEGGAVLKLPQWAQSFVTHVDMEGAGTRITAARARAILRSVP